MRKLTGKWRFKEETFKNPSSSILDKLTNGVNLKRIVLMVEVSKTPIYPDPFPNPNEWEIATEEDAMVLGIMNIHTIIDF